MDRREALFPLFAAVSGGTALLIQLLTSKASSPPALGAIYAFSFSVPVLAILAMEIWRMPENARGGTPAERWFVSLLLVAALAWAFGVLAFFWSLSRHVAVVFFIASGIAALTANRYRASLKQWP